MWVRSVSELRHTGRSRLGFLRRNALLYADFCPQLFNYGLKLQFVLIALSKVLLSISCLLKSVVHLLFQLCHFNRLLGDLIDQILYNRFLFFNLCFELVDRICKWFVSFTHDLRLSNALLSWLSIAAHFSLAATRIHNVLHWAKLSHGWNLGLLVVEIHNVNCVIELIDRVISGAQQFKLFRKDVLGLIFLSSHRHVSFCHSTGTCSKSTVWVSWRNSHC